MKLYSLAELMEERQALTRLLNQTLGEHLTDDRPIGIPDLGVISYQMDMVDFLMEQVA